MSRAKRASLLTPAKIDTSISKRNCPATSATCILFVCLALALISVSFARSAHAAETPTWELTEVRSYSKSLPNGEGISASFGQGSLSMSVDYHHDHKEWMDFPYDVSWNEQVRWSDPPSRIAVGAERDVKITFNASYSDYSYKGSTNTWGEEMTSPIPPFSWTAATTGYGAFDPKRTTLDDLFDDFGRRFDEGKSTVEREGYDFFDTHDVDYDSCRRMRFESGGSMPAFSYLGRKDVEDRPSNSFTESCSPTAGFKDLFVLPEDCSIDELAEQFISNWNYDMDDSLDPKTATLGMAFVVSSYTGFNDEGCGTTVYLYTYNPKGTAAPTATDVVIETEAPKESGETDGRSADNPGGWVIPAAIVGGAALVAGVGVALSRRRKGGDDDGRREPPSTYRMLLWKDFGDTLFVGAGPQKIGARIEEQRADGSVVRRDDLSAKIAFGVSENIKAESIGMEGRYQCIAAEATGPVKGSEDFGTVSIKFTGEGGTFTNNVRFRIAELELIFPDIPLTFVAGKRQTWQMPFKFSYEEIAQKCEPRFALRLANEDAGTRFCSKRVLRDEEYPNKLFAVELTECGPVKEDDVAGTMETYTCEVVATLPAGAVGTKECEVRGSFSFFRFTEGLRFTVEPLKCYYVKHMEKAETWANGEQALEMATNAQAQALGLAGGSLASAVGAAATTGDLERGVTYGGVDTAIDTATNVQSQVMGLAGGFVAGVGATAALREVERDVKGRFPEVFREDNPYLFDRRDRVMLTPGRTHAYATLYVVDEFQDEYGRPYLRPITPLPKRDDMQLAFEDVTGSSVLHDKDGNEIAKPVELLDFRYFISRVDRTDNTVVFEILPTKGVMLPPNRSQVDVAAVVKWTDHAGTTRTFTAKERVNAISQPYRVDFDEKMQEYIASDDEVYKILQRIQRKIQLTSGKLAVEGSVSFGQTMSDVGAGLGDAAEEYPVFAKNPVNAAAIALYQLYLSAREYAHSIETQSRDVYHDNLMPLYHYIEMMLEGHQYEFGFFEHDVRRIVTTFARYETGQIGAAEAIDLAYHGHDMMFADALSLTVQEWNRSWTSIGVRIGFALATGGQSEWLFMPMAAIGSGMEASMDYVDKGGDNLLEAYRVGMSATAKHALVEAAFMGAMDIALKCAKSALVLTKEAFSQRQLFVKAIKEMFSSARYGQKVAAAARGLEGQLARASAKADAAIRAYRSGAQVGAQNVEREIAYTLGRLEGGYKLDALRDLALGGGKRLSTFQQKAIIVTIQSDKHAMRALMEATGAEAEAMRSYFSRAIGQIEKDALLKARTVLSERLKIPMDKLRVKGTSGNTGKVSMDLDATFQFYDDAAGQWKDVKAALGQEVFDAEFYKIVKGYAAQSDDVAAAFARNADMTVTDMFHPEAYSPEYADALRVIDARRAGEAFTYGSKVAQVAKYKCEHWLQLGRRAASDAQVARTAGKLTDAQRLAAASEAFAEESARQFTKQADRLIINKIAAMQAKGIKATTSVNVDLFLEKVAVLKRSGMGRFGGTGLTSGEVDAVLKGGYETGLDALYTELETLTVELDNAIKAASKA